MSSPTASLTASDLDRFREVQRLAYRCAEIIAAELEPGVTEREAAGRMKDFLVAEGADDCFHQPFAWFGDRTAFRGFVGFKHLGGFNPAFYPSQRRLERTCPSSSTARRPATATPRTSATAASSARTARSTSSWTTSWNTAS